MASRLFHESSKQTLASAKTLRSEVLLVAARGGELTDLGTGHALAGEGGEKA